MLVQKIMPDYVVSNVRKYKFTCFIYILILF